jgi:hypothetical protein
MGRILARACSTDSFKSFTGILPKVYKINDNQIMAACKGTAAKGSVLLEHYHGEDQEGGGP